MNDLAPFAAEALTSGCTRPLTLDISRLLARARHATPTGIDRVELAYARAVLARGRATGFEAWVPGLGFVSYAPAAVARLVDSLDQRWRTGGGVSLARGLHALGGFRPRRENSEGAVHLIVSHHHLADLDRRMRRRAGSRTCVYVHDTIPSDYPEYARPGGGDRHARRMRNAVALADAVIVNSAATARSLDPFMAAAGRRPPLLVAPLGVEPLSAPVSPVAADEPYFLCLGTIEPRKNHLMLLQVWRALVAQGRGERLPRLVLVGRRGWENENVVDLLDRSHALGGLVTEAGRVGDTELARLITGARAVLMPSFAEGFGLPVAEALAAGVPVIASDIAVLRETGGEVAEYIDPLDGLGWLAAVRDYTRPDSPRRAAQLARLRGWRAPSWHDHFAHVLPFLEAL